MNEGGSGGVSVYRTGSEGVRVPRQRKTTLTRLGESVMQCVMFPSDWEAWFYVSAEERLATICVADSVHGAGGCCLMHISLLFLIRDRVEMENRYT